MYEEKTGEVIMKKEFLEKYLAFKKRFCFLTVYTVDQERITMRISKNVVYRQPYSKQWHIYIKNTCLQIYPKVENPLHIFGKLYHWIKIERPVEKVFSEGKNNSDFSGK